MGNSFKISDFLKKITAAIPATAFLSFFYKNISDTLITKSLKTDETKSSFLQ